MEVGAAASSRRSPCFARELVLSLSDPVDGFNQDDCRLMRDVQAGRTDSFAVLFRRYQPALLRVAESRLGRRDWADDVVQETFLAAFASRMSFDTAANFRTWLWTIMFNQCRRHYKRRRKRAKMSTENLGRSSLQDEFDANQLPSGEPTPASHILAKERRLLLEDVLTRLSDVQADAVRLRFFAGLKFREIAQVMGCSLPTAKNRVRWGLTRISEMLAERKHAMHDLIYPDPGEDR